MSSHPSRKAQNELVARRKALDTYVHISGLSGRHTLQVGLAYYYRGHYMYAYPAGTLIEPIPYSTRKGIMIQGFVSASAPAYDADDAALCGEEQVKALEKSVEAEMNAREVAREESVAKTTDAVEGLTTSKLAPVLDKGASVVGALSSTSRPSSPALRLAPPPGDLHVPTVNFAAPRHGASNTFTPRHGHTFLAASAPGSRLGSRSGSPSGLRPTSSHAGLARLGAIRGPFSPPCSGSGVEANAVAEDDSSCPSPAVGYLVGLGDHALGVGGLPGGLDGRVGPCALHGEECDGVFVGHAWLTEQTRWGLGFVEELPMIEREGRRMVDWAGLLEEQR